MSDSKYFAKCKASEIRAEIDQAKKKLKPHARVQVVLKKVVANIILGKNDLAVLMPNIIDLMTIDDFQIRKHASYFVVHYAPLNQKDAQAALSFYSRFLSESNPGLRSLALKTVSSVNLPSYLTLGVAAAKHLLADPSPRVRTTAAFAVARMFMFDQKKVMEAGLVDALNELLYDENSTVVANALAALSSVTETGALLGLTIDVSHSLALARSLSEANEWRQCYILNALMSFVPQTSEDAAAVLEQVIPCLLHANLAVVLNAVKVIVYFSNYVPAVENSFQGLPRRIGSSLMSLLGKSAEIQFLVLRNIILLLLGKRYLLDVSVEQFFWKFNDPIYIKDTKLEIIYLLASESNIAVVFRELEEYATEIDVRTARKAIRAFGNLAVKLPVAVSKCVDILLDLVSDELPYVVQEASVVLRNIFRKYPGQFNFAIPQIVRHYKNMTETDARVAIVWMIGQFPNHVEDAEHVLSYYVSSFPTDPIEVQYATITATVKYYVKYPANGEALLLKVLKWATEESDNPDVRDRGFFYWRMITNEANNGKTGGFQEKTKEIIIDPNPIITSENENIDPTILEELELNIGTLASVYLKSVKHVFRFAKNKQLQRSPALQEKRKNKAPASEASNEPIEALALFNKNYTFKPLPEVNRNSSTSTYISNRSSDAYDSSESERKESFTKKITRRASNMTLRKKH